MSLPSSTDRTGSERGALIMTSHRLPQEERPLTRREAICRCGTGFGVLGLATLLAETGFLNRAHGGDLVHPLAARRPPLPAKAKHVIHLFMNGGPSHVDTFDPKPSLARVAGKT